VTLAASVCAGAGSAARSPAARAEGPIIAAHDEASFKAALARARAGTTIQLTDGDYPQLTVEKRTFAGPVLIIGSRNAKIAGIAFVGSTNLVLKGVTVTPPGGATAKIAITDSSRKIVIDGVVVDGRDEDVGAFIQTEVGTSDVTLRNSELTNCGRGHGCVRPGARNLRVVGNRFYDCRSCTFIKGGGNGALVRGNTFDLAHNVKCTGGQASCPHNDHIHIGGGGPWTIIANRFGDYEAGAAQVYANPGLSNDSNPIHDLLIASNIFVGDGGLAIRIGVGQKSRTPTPKKVRIVNNTILSGRLSGLLLVPLWAEVPAAERPLVANNILSSVHASSCGGGRFVRNLVLRRPACANDPTGDAKLVKKTAAPTPKSSLVINKADPRYAPKTDFYGRRRKGPPDKGAIELGGR
jgi:parallel beta helix pectate lyase-like protein